MDEKFIRRFESFKNSLDSLAWKVMKDILIQYYAITGFVAGSPREVLKHY